MGLCWVCRKEKKSEVKEGKEEVKLIILQKIRLFEMLPILT